MCELNSIEKLYYDLFEKKISIRQFEKIINREKWSELELDKNEYEELIGINYGEKEAKFNVKKVLINRIDYQRIEFNRFKKILSLNLNGRLNWEIVTYEYGTRYGITTPLESKVNFTFLQPIETSIHKSSKYHTKKGIYDALDKKLNIQVAKNQDLLKLISTFHSSGDLIFCYNHDVDEFSKYFNDDNSEIKFHINDIYGKVKKKVFMNALEL